MFGQYWDTRPGLFKHSHAFSVLQGYIESVSESEVSKSCLTLRPHGLEPTRLRDRTWVSSIAGRRFYHLSHQESPIYHYTCLKQIPGNLTTESHTWFFVFFFLLTPSTPSCIAYKNKRWSSLREPGQKENWNLSETGSGGRGSIGMLIYSALERREKRKHTYCKVLELNT